MPTKINRPEQTAAVSRLAPAVQHHVDALRWVGSPAQLCSFVFEALAALSGSECCLDATGEGPIPALTVHLFVPLGDVSHAKAAVNSIQRAAAHHQCWGLSASPTTRASPLGSVLCTHATRSAAPASVLLATAVVCRRARLDVPLLRRSLDLTTGAVRPIVSPIADQPPSPLLTLRLEGLLCASKVRELHAATATSDPFNGLPLVVLGLLALPPAGLQSASFNMARPVPALPYIIRCTREASLADVARRCFPELGPYLSVGREEVMWDGVPLRVRMVSCHLPHPAEDPSFSVGSIPPLSVLWEGGGPVSASHPLVRCLTFVRSGTLRRYDHRTRQLNRRIAGGSAAANDAALMAALALAKGNKRPRALQGDGLEEEEDDQASTATGVPLLWVLSGCDDPAIESRKRELAVLALRTCGLPVPQFIAQQEAKRAMQPPKAPVVEGGRREVMGLDYHKLGGSILPVPPEVTAPSPGCFLASPDLTSLFASLSNMACATSTPNLPPPCYPSRVTHADGSFSVSVLATPNVASSASPRAATPRLTTPRRTTPLQPVATPRAPTTATCLQGGLPTLPVQVPRLPPSSYTLTMDGSGAIAPAPDHRRFDYSLAAGLSCVRSEARCLHRDMFAPDACQVLGQWDKKFIVALLRADASERVLVCLDQHAVHERVRLEYFLAGLVGYCSPSPIPPSAGGHLSVPPHLHLAVARCRQACEYWGWRLEPTTAGGFNVTHCPTVAIEGYSYQLNRWFHFEGALREMGGAASSQLDGPFPAPSCIVQVAVLRSCRGAIMFGHELSLSQCQGVVHALPLVNQYTVCSHGRTSIVPLTDTTIDQYM